MNIIDLHCDTLDKLINENYFFKENNGHISEENLLKGGYMAQCFAVYTPPQIKGKEATEYFNRQCDIFDKMLKQSECIVKVKNSIESNFKEGKISAIFTVENGELLNNNTDNIELLKGRRTKILGLVHNGEICLGFPCSEKENEHRLPLKQFGREVVDILNGTDIFIDVSHLNFGGFMDVADISKKPFIATHSGCFELCRNKRNLTDKQIRIIGNSGGIIGTVFYSKFLNGSDKTAIEDILRHIEHFIKIGGENIAALGSDFDGMDCNSEIKNASEMQKLSDAIIKKFGYNVAEKVCYKNVLNLL